MAITTLTPVAKEGGTYLVTVSFTDEDTPANPVIPSAAVWTLVDSSGAVVNSRSNEVISPLASTVYILLESADLVVSGHRFEELLITVTATYNSDQGTGLKNVQQAKIGVEAV